MAHFLKLKNVDIVVDAPKSINKGFVKEATNVHVTDFSKKSVSQEPETESVL